MRPTGKLTLGVCGLLGFAAAAAGFGLAGLWTPAGVAVAADADNPVTYTYSSPEDDQPILDKPGQDPVYYIDFAFERPRWIKVTETDPATKQQVQAKYLFMFYKVTNFGNKKIDFRPDFVLVTDTGREYRAQNYNNVYEAIRKQYKRDYILSQIDVNNAGLPDGEDNAKHGVAIFPEPDARSDAFDVYVGALTNYPVRKVKNPLFKPDQSGSDKKEDEYFLTNRVLRLHYEFPGYPGGRDHSHASLESVKWTWR
jgi:hypothetical protein